MTPEQLKAWRKDMGLIQANAAKALGLSKDTIVTYEGGVNRKTGEPVVIPRVVALACAAVRAGLDPEGG